MSINAKVRIIAEDTGAVIQVLGTVSPYTSVNDEFEVTVDGGSPVLYKVEKLRNIVKIVNRSSDISAPKYSITNSVDIIVSVVP